MVRNHEPDVELAESFAEVARSLLGEPDVNRTLETICTLAVETVEGCEAAGVSLINGGEIAFMITADDLPRRLHNLQAEARQGPCIDVIRESAVFVTGSLSDDTRWPAFAPRATETGVQSFLVLRLFAGDVTIGTLELYSGKVSAFDDRDIAVASVFAAHAAVALTSAQRKEQLENKAASRDLIGMAKGIIMAHQQVSDDQAFEILRMASQRMNVKLRELAREMVGRLGGEGQIQPDR